MAPHLVFGAGSIGTTPKGFVYTWDTPDKVLELLSVLERLDIRELDSAASYPPTNPWNTETLLGQTKAAERGFIIDSKVAGYIRDQPHLHDEGVRASVDRSLELLGIPKLRTLYAHRPDPLTPLEEQAKAFHRQYEAGKFERLGLCNFSAEAMARYFAICEEKGYVKPTVYQGMYNALARDCESELLPLLRKHGCVFYAFSPLAGGFLTGKVTEAATNPDSESASLGRTRWRGESTMAIYSTLYDKPAMHDAIRHLKAVCEAASPPLTTQEAAMRWIVHHSALREGDGVIFGAKRFDQLDANVSDARRGPLEAAVLEAVEGLWDLVQNDGKET